MSLAISETTSSVLVDDLLIGAFFEIGLIWTTLVRCCYERLLVWKQSPKQSHYNRSLLFDENISWKSSIAKLTRGAVHKDELIEENLI